MLMHNYPQTPNGCTDRIDVDFTRIERNCVRAQRNRKSVSITAKLSKRFKKIKYFMDRKPKAKSKNRNYPTANKTLDKFNPLRRQNISLKLHRDHILLSGGSTYKEEVPIIKMPTHSRSHRRRHKT